MRTQKKYDIFISYSRKDIDEVNLFVNMLQKRIPTLTCWFDITGIESGDEFEEKIIAAIDNSSYVLFILSDNSIQSQWTKDEVMYAKNIGKKVIPILLNGSKLDEGWFLFKFGRIDCIDSKSSIQIDKLVRDLSDWTNKEAILVDVTDEGRNIYSQARYFQIPQDRGCTIIFPKGDGVVRKVYDSGKEISTELTPVCELESKELDNRQETSRGFSFRFVTARKKGCLLTISILAVFLIVCIPIVQMRFGEVGRSSIPSVESASVQRNKILLKAIDLNLPSGTLWANINVGAKAEYDYGSLYAWGEMQTKEDYCESKYDYEKISEHYRITRSPIFDVASVGNNYNSWQLPTIEQFEELLKECKWSWAIVDGRKGYQIEGSNGNMIFLPASGWIDKTDITHRGLYGYYWTGERVNKRFAKQLIFSKAEVKIGNGYLHYGRSIRPVLVKQDK